ncbi:MAG: hypothetical protein H7A45_10935 [Verrucomicrobiales bacterium]|nr:hypothetical protein [Verrucomicrobiales bacterium]
MEDNRKAPAAVDRIRLTASSPAQTEEEDRRYWWSRTPGERLRHVEFLREMNHGSDAVDEGLQRVLTVLERPPR